MLIRNKQIVILKKATKIKQANGNYINEYQYIDEYPVQKQTLEDEVSATIYGANLNNVIRLKSPHCRLEKYLITKLNNKEDNISKYFIFINDVCYKITAVTERKIDIEKY